MLRGMCLQNSPDSSRETRRMIASGIAFACRQNMSDYDIPQTVAPLGRHGFGRPGSVIGVAAIVVLWMVSARLDRSRGDRVQ